MNDKKMRDWCISLLEVMDTPRGPENLAVLSGTLPEGGLNAFLQQWGLPREDMPWCFWEKISGVGVDRLKLPPLDEEFWLDWLHVFGVAGHLTVRRVDNDNSWQWYFVGEPLMPPEQLDAVDFWKRDQAPDVLHEWEKSVLLWGVYNDAGLWIEDRVARAKIDYCCPGWKRVNLHYRVYTAGGREELVWFLGLEESVNAKG